jgi:two-component system LytT family sensor kinase
MTLASQPYRAPQPFKPEPSIFVPLFLILSLVGFVNSIQAYYLLQPDIVVLSTFSRIVLSKMIYFWYFLLPAFVVRWYAKRVALERHTVFAWFSVHLLTLALSFFIHETLSLEVEKFIWPVESKGALFYTLFNNPSVWIEILMYALFVLGFYALEYKKRTRENAVKRSRLEILLVKSRLQEVRNKIRPTFLFQTLQTILELTRIGRNKDANHILSLLSDFLRTTVYDTDREEIALEEEMRFLNRYLEIEKIRSGRLIRISEEIPMEAAGAAVPNFIIQPIVDELISRTIVRSAIRHEIAINAKRNGKELEVIIEDRCRGFDEDPKAKADREAVLAITRERLGQLYRENQALTVSSQADGAIRVEIRIPFRETDEQSEAMLVAEIVQ